MTHNILCWWDRQSSTSTQCTPSLRRALCSKCASYVSLCASSLVTAWGRCHWVSNEVFSHPSQRTDAGPYKPIGWLLTLRCLSLTHFSPLHAHRQGHTHIHTRQHTRTHTPYTCNIHNTSLHTHTHPLEIFTLTTGPLPCCWRSKPSSSGAKPSLSPGGKSGIEVLTKDTLHPAPPECSLDILGECSHPFLQFLHLAHLAVHLGGFYLRASVGVAVAASFLKHALGTHTQWWSVGEVFRGPPSCSPPGHQDLQTRT